MDFGRSDPLPMQSHIASMHWRNVVRRIGYWKLTFEAVSTISVTIGCSPTCPWIRWFCANGFERGMSIREPCSQRRQEPRKGESERKSVVEGKRVSVREN